MMDFRWILMLFWGHLLLPADQQMINREDTYTLEERNECKAAIITTHIILQTLKEFQKKLKLPLHYTYKQDFKEPDNKDTCIEQGLVLLFNKEAMLPRLMTRWVEWQFIVPSRPRPCRTGSSSACGAQTDEAAIYSKNKVQEILAAIGNSNVSKDKIDVSRLTKILADVREDVIHDRKLKQVLDDVHTDNIWQMVMSLAILDERLELEPHGKQIKKNLYEQYYIKRVNELLFCDPYAKKQEQSQKTDNRTSYLTRSFSAPIVRIGSKLSTAFDALLVANTVQPPKKLHRPASMDHTSKYDIYRSNREKKWLGLYREIEQSLKKRQLLERGGSHDGLTAKKKL